MTKRELIQVLENLDTSDDTQCELIMLEGKGICDLKNIRVTIDSENIEHIELCPSLHD